MISAIVLAAGESRRMGGENKLLLPFEGRPLIARIVHTVLAADVDEVIVVVGHEAGRVREALAGCAVRFVQNDAYREGMITSIHAGVRAASPGAEGFLICLSDLPLIEPGELNRLIAAFKQAGREDQGRIVVPVFAGQRGNPVLFAALYEPDMLDQTGQADGCKGVVRQHRDHVVEVAMETDHVLRDIDTMEDYRREAGYP